MSTPEDFDRRANPPGWVQPKAPYNPYDPTDSRPAKGYPSEFNAPSAKKKNSGSIARNLDDYQRIKVDMKTLQYYPRPPSEMYPGRYKVLRRVNTTSGFKKGANLTAKVSIYGFVIFGIFFYKWNDHENVFAPLRRAQLWVKERILGELNDDDYNDLYNYRLDNPIPQRPLPSIMFDKNVENKISGTDSINNDHIVDRFGTKHVVYAEHIQQKEQEVQMRELEQMLNERQKELEQMRGGLQTDSKSKSWNWKFW